MDFDAYTVIVAPLAKKELDAALSYITDTLENSGAAKDLLTLFEHEKVAIARNPYHFSPVPYAHLGEKGYRRVLLKNYVAFYKIFEPKKQVRIIRFGHQSRDWSHLLQEQ
jgi:plasmid stabilization system protein ParE